MGNGALAPGFARASKPRYDAYYYLHDCGVPYERNAHWLAFFGDVADGIVRALHPSSVMDAGCAMGFLVEALVARGVDAWGIDISEYAISQVHDSIRDRCELRSLTELSGRRFDLVTCIEVLEHIPPDESNRAIDRLCAAADRLLVSTTPDDYREPTHLNVRPPEHWAAAFARRGFFRDLDADVSFVTPWATLYVRRDGSAPETVERYERSYSELLGERAALRTELLQAKDREDDSAGDGALVAGLEDQDAEIDRMRETVLAKDAEIASLRGRLTALEELDERLQNVVSRVRGLLPLPFLRR